MRRRSRIVEHLAACAMAPSDLKAWAKDQLRATRASEAKRREKRAPRLADEREVADEAVRSTAAVYDAVMARAGGRCEAYHEINGVWVRCQLRADHMDHWLGGSGRRKPDESVETCWGLCELHDFQRTRNRPSSAYWNESRRLHDEAHGYPHNPHITRNVG